jgi:hypothetical protein
MKTNSIQALYLGAVTIVSLTMFMDCTKDVGTMPPPPLVKCDSISYQKDMKKLVDENCVRCHNDQLPNGTYDFTKYDELKKASDAGQLYNAIFVATPPSKMPQDSPNVLTPIELGIIKCWIENGEKP